MWRIGERWQGGGRERGDVEVDGRDVRECSSEGGGWEGRVFYPARFVFGEGLDFGGVYVIYCASILRRREGAVPIPERPARGRRGNSHD